MRHRTIAIGAGLAMLALVMAGAAEARNPNCAGGIQYVVQAMRDKEKGNLEDYQREMLKAVDRLTLCASEDPEDLGPGLPGLGLRRDRQRLPGRTGLPEGHRRPEGEGRQEG